jgi:hypothetical protein
MTDGECKKKKAEEEEEEQEEKKASSDRALGADDATGTLTVWPCGTAWHTVT